MSQLAVKRPVTIDTFFLLRDRPHITFFLKAFFLHFDGNVLPKAAWKRYKEWTGSMLLSTTKTGIAAPNSDWFYIKSPFKQNH
jgi:hypothetical protein